MTGTSNNLLWPITLLASELHKQHLSTDPLQPNLFYHYWCPDSPPESFYTIPCLHYNIIRIYPFVVHFICHNHSSTILNTYQDNNSSLSHSSGHVCPPGQWQLAVNLVSLTIPPPNCLNCLSIFSILGHL